MTGIKITTGKPQVVLPDGAETRSYGMLGMRGSGKSNAAVVLAEEFYKQGIPWIALDPKGDWWGIKSSADGKGPGLEVVVFGGPHADVALDPTAHAGVELADVLVSEGLTCIVDMSGWTRSGRIEFLAGLARREGFLDRLYRKHLPEHGTCHLFMEEAHDYLPQQARGEIGKLIDVASKFQTEGRNRGWGCSVISQRSARVHNDVLTQVDILLAFRTVAPPDRDAIEKWVKHHGVARELVASLQELEDGECWLWSPDWLRKELPADAKETIGAGVRRIRFRRRETFDSGATPVRRKGGAKPRKVVMAPIDLKVLEARMASAVQQAQEQDPEILQRRIKDLQKQLSTRPKEAPAPVPESVEVPVEVPVPMLEEKQMKEMRVLLEQLKATGESNREVVMAIERLLKEQATRAERQDKALERVADALEGVIAATDRRTEALRPPPRPQPAPRPAPREPRVAVSTATDGEVQLKRGARKMLEVLARHYPMRVTRAQLGTLAGLSARGGTFGDYLSKLRISGLIEEESGIVQLSKEGLAFVGHVPQKPMSTGELLEQWRGALKAGARRMLDILVEAYPDAMTREELGEASGVVASGGTFGDYLSTLRRNGLIDDLRGGAVRASDSLFLAEQSA